MIKLYLVSLKNNKNAFFITFTFNDMVSTNSNINFEELSFNPFKSNNTLLKNLNDSDFDVFNENLQSINTMYFQIEVKYLRIINQNSLSLLHVNIRRIKGNPR